MMILCIDICRDIWLVSICICNTRKTMSTDNIRNKYQIKMYQHTVLHSLMYTQAWREYVSMSRPLYYDLVTIMY